MLLYVPRSYSDALPGKKYTFEEKDGLFCYTDYPNGMAFSSDIFRFLGYTALGGYSYSYMHV